MKLKCTVEVELNDERIRDPNDPDRVCAQAYWATLVADILNLYRERYMKTTTFSSEFTVTAPNSNFAKLPETVKDALIMEQEEMIRDDPRSFAVEFLEEMTDAEINTLAKEYYDSLLERA